MDAEWVRFGAGLLVAGATGAWGSYLAAKRGVTNAIQDHRDRLVRLETWRGEVSPRVDRLEEFVWPAR